MGRHSTNVPAILSAAVMACLTAVLPNGAAFAQSSVSQAIIGEPNQKTPEVSTEDVRRILADGSGIVIDARKRSEYVAGHIAGAKSAMLEASSTPAAFVAAVERLVGSDKSRQLVLYCNGPNCKASIQLGEMLVSSGYANVRRYQLGLPMWRTLSGPVEIELEGILRVYTIDRTAVFLDARSATDFSRRSLPGSHNVPADKLSIDGLGKAPMPGNDFNTRIILFASHAEQARTLADAIAKTPYQNVSYYPGTFESLAEAAKANK